MTCEKTTSFDKSKLVVFAIITMRRGKYKVFMRMDHTFKKHFNFFACARGSIEIINTGKDVFFVSFSHCIAQTVLTLKTDKEAIKG